MNGKGKIPKNIANNIDTFTNKMAQHTFMGQILFGAASGWITGAVAVRLGKTLALTVGGIVILIQIAHYNGYIDYDWKKLMDKSVEKRPELESKYGQETNKILSKVKNFSTKNRVFTAGFLGGFLIGLAT